LLLEHENRMLKKTIEKLREANSKTSDTVNVLSSQHQQQMSSDRKPLSEVREVKQVSLLQMNQSEPRLQENGFFIPIVNTAEAQLTTLQAQNSVLVKQNAVMQRKLSQLETTYAKLLLQMEQDCWR
jgi:hypothetical protein